MKKHIKTAIIINASREKIWNIFSDYKNYPKWNPFISFVEGHVKVGEKIKIHAGGMTFKPKVLVYKEQSELRWVGKLFMKGIFDGEHIFQFIDNNNGSVTFKHEEKFSGILVGLFSKKLDIETKRGFQEMNQRLKELSENRS